MSDIRSPDSILFGAYLAGKKKRIFPWCLSIVDCYFLWNAFAATASSAERLTLTRISNEGRQKELRVIRDAYDIYDIDNEANEFEYVVLHEESGANCYWDESERFVAISGPDEFLSIACPVPEDIELHRYIEAMENLGVDPVLRGGAGEFFKMIKLA